MNEFKFKTLNIFLLVLLGLSMYWSFTKIDNRIVYQRSDIVSEEDLKTPYSQENQEEEIFYTQDEEKTPSFEDQDVEREDSKQEEKVNTDEELISSLRKLAEKKQIFDKGDRGENIAIIQRFLKEYFSGEEDVRIDKDFGPTTKRLVKTFQEREMNGGDGRVGPNTLKGMIQWLEK